MRPAYEAWFHGSERIVETASFLAFLSTYETCQTY